MSVLTSTTFLKDADHDILGCPRTHVVKISRNSFSDIQSILPHQLPRLSYPCLSSARGKQVVNGQRKCDM